MREAQRNKLELVSKVQDLQKKYRQLSPYGEIKFSGKDPFQSRNQLVAVQRNFAHSVAFFNDQHLMSFNEQSLTDAITSLTNLCDDLEKHNKRKLSAAKNIKPAKQRAPQKTRPPKYQVGTFKLLPTISEEAVAKPPSPKFTDSAYASRAASKVDVEPSLPSPVAWEF
jgi:hypothetical protein